MLHNLNLDVELVIFPQKQFDHEPQKNQIIATRVTLSSFLLTSLSVVAESATIAAVIDNAQGCN